MATYDDQGLAAALRELPVPNHTPDFFDRLQQQVEGERRNRSAPTRPPRRARPRLRRALLPAVAIIGAIAVAGVLLNRGSTTVPPPSSSSCAMRIEWHGEVYWPIRLHERASLPGSLGEGTIPGCDNHPAIPMAISRIARVSPRIAIAQTGRPGSASVPAGYFPQLQGFPLHRLLAQGSQRPACSTRVSLTGTVVSNIFRLDLAGISGSDSTNLPQRVTVLVTGATRFVGYPALPRVLLGQRVAVIAAACHKPGSVGKTLTAITVQNPQP